MSKREKDYFYNLAKKKGVNARSYFKLEQIHQKYRIFKSGQVVFDIGCAPGSWLQYVHTIVGDQGHLTGVDLASMELSFPNLDFFQMDIFDFDPQRVLTKHGQIDVVISDVAPKTTGNQLVDHERSFQLSLKALNLAKIMLKPHKGSFVCKMYQGESFERYKELLEESFLQVHIYRPKATRKLSREIFWVAKGRRLDKQERD